MADTKSNTAEKFTTNTKDQVNEFADKASEKACQLGADVSERIDGAISSAGDKMQKLGSALREKGPKEGQVGSMVNSVADGLEKSGEYLANKDLNALGDDMTSIVKKYPAQSLAAAAGLGLLFGWACRSSRR